MTFPEPTDPVVIQRYVGWEQEAFERGWHLSSEGTNWDLTGYLLEPASLEDGAEVLVRGGGIVIDSRPGWLRLLDDARRAGVKTWSRSTEDVDEETAALLDALVNGSTIREAADSCYVSLRTANRRLAAARRAFSVANTHALVAAWSDVRTRVERRKSH